MKIKKPVFSTPYKYVKRSKKIKDLAKSYGYLKPSVKPDTEADIVRKEGRA